MIHATLDAQSPIIISELSTQDEILKSLKYYKHPFTQVKIGNSLHVRSLKGGFEIQFKNGKVDTFFAYFRTNKMTSFQGTVRWGIHQAWTIKAAVMYLGQPSTKSQKLVQIIYPHLGIGLVFQGTWNNENSPIQYVYLFQKQQIRICSGCAKKFTKCQNNIGNLYNRQEDRHLCKCGIVSYCSIKCLKSHYGHHLIFCQEGDAFFQ